MFIALVDDARENNNRQLTYEPSETLFGDFDAERARRVRFVAGTLDRNVPIFVKFLVSAAVIRPFGVFARGTLIALDSVP